MHYLEGNIFIADIEEKCSRIHAAAGHWYLTSTVHFVLFVLGKLITLASLCRIKVISKRQAGIVMRSSKRLAAVQ